MSKNGLELTSPLVVFADDWGRHPSSCQHLIRRLRKDVPVLWVNTIGTRQVKADSFTFRRGLEKIKNWGKGLTQVADQMWVMDVPMLPGLANPLVRAANGVLVTRRLKQVLRQLNFGKPVVLTTLPYIAWLIRQLPRKALVYYCTDDYSHWPSADKATLQQADYELNRDADLILAASQLLLKHHSGSGRCHYFPHGVDFEHFASAQQQKQIPDAISSLPQPRIGFFGLIYEKLDFELLTALSRRFPQGSLVMIGPVAYCPEEFSKLPNVHLLGAKPYEELPNYIAGLDALLLPYRDDPMIRQSGPLKLRECLASGKPTISIDVPEVRLLEPFVRIGKTQEEFLEQVNQAVGGSSDPTLTLSRQEVVKQDGWDRRAEELKAHLQKLLYGNCNRPSVVNGRHSVPKVLHLRTVTGKGGGPEKTILNSPRFLIGKYQLRMAYIRPQGDSQYDMPERAAKLGVDLVDIPEKGAWDPLTFYRLIEEVRQFQPSILHAHDYKTNVFAALLGFLFRIPAITTMHGYVTRGGRLEAYYKIDRWALRQMHHIIGVSPDLCELLPTYGISPSHFSLIENAIDTEQFTRSISISDAKNRLGLNPSRLLIGAVGRLSPEKGFDNLIKCIGQLLGKGLDVELVIIGDGPQRAELEELIQESGNKDRIRLAGHQSNVKDWYEAMDVFALSSLREGLPNVLLEAMALEVPVVATKIAGVPRLITDDENGLLVEPGSVSELAEKLHRMLVDESLRHRLAKAGRERVETHHSFAVRMQKIQALYDDLLRRNRSNIPIVQKNGSA